LPGQIDGHTLLSAPIGSLFTRLASFGEPLILKNGSTRVFWMSYCNEAGVRRNILQWRVLGCDTFEEQIVGSCSVLAGRDAYGACHLPIICTKLAQKCIQVNLLPAFEFLPIDGLWVKLFIIEQLC